MITQYFDMCKNILDRKKLDFRKLFFYWEPILLERIMNIFKWNGLDFPQKEIEILLTYKGFCGVIKRDAKLVAVNGGMSGVTNYPDEFTTFTWTTPLMHGMSKIGKDIVLVNNNQIRFPTYKIVETYAVLLAHADLSLQAILINSRATGMAKARTQQQVDSINEYYNAMANGKTLAILDKENLNALMGDGGIELFSNSFPSAMSIDQYYQIRTNLLKSFYADIGLNALRDKRERMVENEVDADINHVLFNVADMKSEREQSAKQMSELFQREVTVDYEDEIKEQFETPEPISPTKPDKGGE